MALRERWDGFTYAWRHLPIGELHPNANGAALAAEGAAEQEALLGVSPRPARASGCALRARPLELCGTDRVGRGAVDGRHARGAPHRAHPRRRALGGRRRASRRRRGCSSRACGGTAAGSPTRWRARCVQPWPGEVLDERSGEIAVGFAALLTRQAAWRHRRVETITVLSHERVRRHVSVDFTVPEAHRAEIELSDGQCVVPLAYLAKRLLVNFDLFMEDEAAVPLLRSDEAQSIARELLYVMLDIDTEDAIEEDIGPLIEWILAAGPGEEDAVDAAVERTRGRARAAAGVRRAGVAAHARLPAVRRGQRRVAAAGAQVRVRPAAGAPEPHRALLRHAGLHAGRVVSRRGQGAGGDAGAHDRAARRPHRERCSRAGRATPTGPRSTTSPSRT